METQPIESVKIQNFYYDSVKKIRVFSMPWHVANQYEMLKVNFDWTYLVQHTRTWSESSRPMPKHLKWAPYYEPGKYDVAILHVDQQCLLPQLGKSIVYREVRKQIKDIPVIVVNHGTPVYPEVFIQLAEEAGMSSTEESSEKWARDEMKKLMSDVDLMIVNSHEAQKQWGFGKTIVHGLDAEEWFDLPKEPRIVTCISPAGLGDKYYGRRFFQEVRSILEEKYGVLISWIGETGFAPSWELYKEFLGKSLIYFNPTIGSPMPRSRTEAMFSGCCVVTTKFQDADKFIEHGKDGFLVDLNPEATADLLGELMSDYKRAIKVGQAGKEKAKAIFSGGRFRNDWMTTVNDVLNKK